MKYSKRLLLLAADVFDLAADRMPDNVCNDFEAPHDLTDDDAQRLADLHDLANMGTKQSLAEWRAVHPEDATTAEDIRTGMTSWVLAGAMAHMIRRMAEDQSDLGKHAEAVHLLAEEVRQREALQFVHDHALAAIKHMAEDYDSLMQARSAIRPEEVAADLRRALAAIRSAKAG